MRRLAIIGAAAAALVVTAAAPAAEAARRAPTVDHMVVYRSGKAKQRRVRARGALVRVGRRRCAAGTGTPLAALVRSRPGRLRLRDFGSCSRRAEDGSGLFVSAIGRDRNRRQNGWVYKVGRRAGTAGAADPSGPFGRGRLRSRQRVTWFYCRMGRSGCQRTLVLRTRVEGRTVVARVVGYDDAGRGLAVAGARVVVGGARALTNPAGYARLAVAPGRWRARAGKRGLVRSFTERVVVR